MLIPQPRIRKHWIDRIRQAVSDNPGLTASDIYDQLVKATANRDIELSEYEAVPSQRTIGRELTAFKRETAETREQYERVYWPETFQRGASGLPWEASRDVLELLDMIKPERPTVRQARWWWRVQLAAPEMDKSLRLALALGLDTEDVQSIEGYSEDKRWVENRLIEELHRISSFDRSHTEESSHESQE
jgi:hypothetical protein